MSDTVIRIENLSKQYRLGETGTGTIADDLNRWWHKVRGKEDPFLKVGEINDRTTKGTSDYVWAIRDIDFAVKRGEVLGIIGKNGAGKSTLLKLLSRVTSPTTGKIKTKGRIASLLEVGTGFHDELTGRENIFLNGAIMGMTKAEVRARLDEIIDFSGTERYIDTPVKRYSSGMRVRLGFAVAAHLDPEILIVDEVLAVGDADFQKKAIGKMQDVSKGGGGRTVLFVSHDLNAVSQLCTRGILLKNGHVFYDGNVNDMISQYLSDDVKKPFYINSSDSGLKPALIKSITLMTVEGKVSSDFLYNEPIIIEFHIKLNDPRLKAELFVLLLDGKKRRIFACEAMYLNPVMRLKIPQNLLVRGNYSLHAFINVPKIEQIDVVEDECNFRIIDSGSRFAKHGDYDYGVVFGDYEWL